MGEYFLEDIEDNDVKNKLYENAETTGKLGSWLINIHTKKIILSPNYYRIFGKDAEEIQPGTENFRGLIYPDDYESVLNAENNALEGHITTLEYRIFFNGSLRYLRQLSTLITDSKGNKNVSGTIQDITEQKITQQQLSATTSFIEHVADATPDIIFIMNINTKKLVYNNRKLSLMLGYSAEESGRMASTIFDIMYEDDIPRMIAHIDNMKTAADNEVRTIEYRMKDISGKLRWFIDRNSVFARDINNVPVEKIGICHEITDVVQQQEELLKNLNILKQAEAITLIGSWQYNLKTNTFEWSEGMYRMFGIESGISVNPDIYVAHAIDEDKEYAEKIAEYIRSGSGPFEQKLRIKVRDEIRVLKIRSVVLKNKLGKAKEVIGVDLDITDLVKNEMSLKELNTTLVRKNKELKKLNSELTQFFYVTGHDLKEPLRKVYTFLEMILNKEAPNLTDAGRSYFRRAQGAIQRLNLLTDDIVSFSQVNSEHHVLVDVNLNHIVNHVLEALKESIAASGIKIECEELPMVKGYRILLSLLFLHLVDNSIKFRNQNVRPTLKITAQRANGSVIKLPEVNEDTDYVIISFIDNGIGFDQASAEKIFEMFHRLSLTKFRGSGIGLAIAHKVMDAHHGFITAKSETGKGSKFTCYFPA